MSGRKRATISPTLFPFLAVLVCTLGTLILFLALVAQKAEQTAQEVVENPEAPESAASLVAEQQWLRDRYVAIREQQTAELQERASQLTHIEDHLRRLRKELQELQETTIVAQASTFDESAKQQEIDRLQQAILDEQQRVEALQQELPNRRPRVVIVPHKGPHGTDQRPIYVECTAEGVRVQPEGSFISKLQLEGPPGPGNPLDAALRAVRYHWQQTDPAGADPYPLLVVRPDGIETYAAARTAMQNWDDQFGYELVPGETELAFPTGDNRLKEKVDVAIREAVTRQHARLAASSYIRRRQSGGGGGRPRVLSAAELARNGATGGGGQRHFSRPVNSDTTSRSGNIAGSDIRDFDDALQSAANAPPAGSGLSGDLGSTDNQSWNSGLPAGTNQAPGGDVRLGAANGAGELGEPGGSAGSEGTVAMNDQLAANGVGRLDENGRIDGQSEGPSSGDQNALGATGGSQATPSQGEAGQQPTQTNPYAASQAPPQRQAPAPASSEAEMAHSNSQPNSQSNSAGSSASASSASNGSGQTDTKLRRGSRDWALPSTARGRGTSIVRGLRVVCLPDAFVLMSEDGQSIDQRFTFQDGFVDRAAMQLATAVHDRVDSWGFAIAGGRWQPVLRVEVDRDAEPRYRQLRTLLQGSGLELEKR